MSKAKLKKELSTLSKEQLIEVILTLYTARKDAKEYFEFFLDPDVNALKIKVAEMIMKEFSRQKRGYAKFRIAQIKSYIKYFESFGVEAESVLNLMVLATEMYLLVPYNVYLPEEGYTTMGNFVKYVLKYADGADLLNVAIDALTKYSRMKLSPNSYPAHTLEGAIQEYLDDRPALTRK